MRSISAKTASTRLNTSSDRLPVLLVRRGIGVVATAKGATHLDDEPGRGIRGEMDAPVGDRRLGAFRPAVGAAVSSAATAHAAPRSRAPRRASVSRMPRGLVLLGWRGGGAGGDHAAKPRLERLGARAATMPRLQGQSRQGLGIRGVQRGLLGQLFERPFAQWTLRLRGGRHPDLPIPVEQACLVAGAG